MTKGEPESMPSDAIRNRCAPITLIVMDVDGVLTAGGIALNDRGIEHKDFFVRDGSAVALWRKAGHRAAILSGRNARCVDRRAAELGIHPVIQGTPHKAEPFRKLLRELNVTPNQVCYIGDDLPDLPALLSVGFAACPADAVPEVRAAVHYVAEANGGRGAVREIIETILKSQNAWDALIAPYHQPAFANGP